MKQVQLRTLLAGVRFIYHCSNGIDVECLSIGGSSYRYYDIPLEMYITLNSPDMLCDVVETKGFSRRIRHALHIETGE